MAEKYNFKVYNPDPSDPKGWVPVMWAKRDIEMFFSGQSDWTAEDFKVFQVYPEDKKNAPLPGFPNFPGINNAEEAKAYIIANQGSYTSWDPKGDRYSGGSGGSKKATFKTKNKKDNEITIKDEHNGGKKPKPGSSDVNPVYDFIVRFKDKGGKYILVDPRIRNEY